MSYKITIAGLGLMGASLAMALKGFKDAEITGMDIKEEVREKALEKGVVSACYADIAEAAQNTDLLIFCVYPAHIPALFEKCKHVLKPGTVVTDICGVKKNLYKKLLPAVPADVSYIGIHPMAGRERDGIDNADETLYQNSGFLICLTGEEDEKAHNLMKEMAEHLGCRRVESVSYQKHDEIIAYTSDLMHISAAGLCLDYHKDMSFTFTAGAFRDCTRIADINADAWTELLLANDDNVLHCLDSYIAGLEEMREAICKTDAPALRSLLTKAGNNKREMLQK